MSDMKIVDVHHHLLDEPGYLDGLLRAMDSLGVEQACVSGLGPLFRMADNDAVRGAFEAHPDRIVGAVFIRPGADRPEAVDRAFEQGFRMVKVTVPKAPYDDPRYDEFWRRACERKMPVLFHTGIVNTPTEMPDERISSWFMHPMRLEPISRRFPSLSLIAAHLGVCWNLEAAELARMRPNVYVDLTGAPTGWRLRADAEGMEKFLWWPGAFDKVLFGTDVHYRDMPEVLRQDLARMDRLRLPVDTRRRVLRGNITRLLSGGSA